jgi:microcystin-dependent protein
MSDQFLGEVRIFGCNFAPTGWAFCGGQLLPISQYTALFSLLGTQFGGDGKSTFALPNLQGNVPLHFGQGPGLTPYSVGDSGGVQGVTLLNSEMPAHNHTANCNSALGNKPKPNNNYCAADAAGILTQYAPAPDGSQMNVQAISIAGGSQPHNNMQPYLTLNFCIALVGIFPSRA